MSAPLAGDLILPPVPPGLPCAACWASMAAITDPPTGAPLCWGCAAEAERDRHARLAAAR